MNLSDEMVNMVQIVVSWLHAAPNEQQLEDSEFVVDGLQPLLQRFFSQSEVSVIADVLGPSFSFPMMPSGAFDRLLKTTMVLKTAHSWLCEPISVEVLPQK